MRHKSSGFTLIELSIVVVIIALIIGGVMVGKSVMRNAELQSIISDINRYEGAAKIFRDKYKYLPGDFPNAVSIWGDQEACPAINTSKTTNTCNGNGDGLTVNVATPDSDLSGGTTPSEVYLVWKHLINAELMVADYDRLGYGRTKSKLGGNMYSFFYSSPTSAATNVYDAKYKHVIVYGSTGGSSTLPSYGAGLSNEDALSIDQKMDDGVPGTGLVLTFNHTFLANCASSDTQSSATYQVSVAGQQCSLIFITGY